MSARLASMRNGASTGIVVSVAALVGVALAQGAGAAPGDPAPTAPTAHDDSEPDDPRGANGDNPYDESRQGRPAVVRQAVVARDGMLLIPGGRFTMGSSNAHTPANEHPAHAMVVPPFWIDRTEVTVSAYRACVDAGTCSRPARTSPACTYDAGDPELPVSCVHWRDADAYCHFANKRLPGEAEWEYAARGPYQTAFPWGTIASCSNAVTLILDSSANPCSPHPAHVGTHPGGASVWGVLDMSGNVEEWTADWYVEQLGPGPAPRSGSAHVLRGGGWLSTPTMSRTTARDWGSALEAGPNMGFRCVKNVE
jgi:formylglycine-generating enzyme required for sulfatase activity